VAVPLYVTREQYFTAATEILSEQGYHRLKMTALHQRLGVTSGSFYHYFKNWPDFVAGFLAYWTAHTNQIAEKSAATPDPLDRLELLRALTRTVPHDAEVAIRTWSAMDPMVAAAQRDVDRRRIDIIRTAVVEATGSERDADRFAELGLSMIVGWQQLRQPFDPEAMDWMLTRFIAMVTPLAKP
jgi:AcrR family transcriptional regulator